MSNIMQDLHTIGLNPFAVTLLAESVLRSPLAPMTVGKPQGFFFPVNRGDCAGWAGVRITVEAVPIEKPDTRKLCTCDGAGRGPGRACVVKAGGRLGELWRCAQGAEPANLACATERDSWSCKNMLPVEGDTSMTHEHYACKVCGRRMALDYDEMR